MKVLQLIQKQQLRGAEVFACQLAKELNKKGYKNVLVALFKGDAPLPYNESILCLNANASKRFVDFKAWKQLAKIIKSEKPDIVQANAGDTLKYAVFSKLIFGWKQPILFRNASTISLYIKSFPAKMLNGFFYRYASHIVSVSETSKQDFIELFPNKKNSISTIPIGIDTIQLPPKKNNFTKKIIHVGGFTYEKNHIGLLRIFKKFVVNHPDSELYLVGTGPLKPIIEKQVKDMHLYENIKLLGFRNDAIELINEADLLVLPSIIEGLPGVILEAMYAQTPVIAYNTGGINEVVKDGVTGRLIKLNDENAFCKAMQEAFLNQEAYSLMVKKAHELVLNYSNEIIATKFDLLYCNLKKHTNSLD